jgi:hypothetical protein
MPCAASCHGFSLFFQTNPSRTCPHQQQLVYISAEEVAVVEGGLGAAYAGGYCAGEVIDISSVIGSYLYNNMNIFRYERGRKSLKTTESSGTVFTKKLSGFHYLCQ